MITYSGRRGFTLIELLVVIAIIAILAAILFPVFIKAKQAAQTTKCVSNMQQIGKALQMYIDDTDGRLPPCYDWGPENAYAGVAQPLYRVAMKYCKTTILTTGAASPPAVMFESAGLFQCPADQGVTFVWQKVPAKRTIWKYTGCSYQFYGSQQKDWEGYTYPKDSQVPWTGLSWNDTRSSFVGAPISAIKVQTKKPMLGDISYWHAGDVAPNPRDAKKNLLFVDGHAARVSYEVYLRGIMQQLAPW